MKHLIIVVLVLLTACAAPSQDLQVTQDLETGLDVQALPGEFALSLNYVRQRVSLQTTTVESPNRVLLDRNSFTGRVQLSLEQRDGTPLPSGISARFLANNTTAAVSTLVVSATPQNTPAIYNLRVKGVSGALTKYASVTLIVSAASTNWTTCTSVSWAACDFDGLREVRFGANGKYVSKYFYDFVPSCYMWAFDDLDPAPGVNKTCEYGPLATAKRSNPNPSNGLGRSVTVPLGDPGSGELRVQPTTVQPGASDGTGNFRVVCNYTHMAFDDPIIYPGQPGKSHLHTFFGNTRTNAATTPTSLATSGNSSCHGGIANRSAYWVPTLLDAQNQPVLPASAIMYYKTGYRSVIPASVKQIPTGLRMISGDALSSVTQEAAGWGCLETYIGHYGYIPTASDHPCIKEGNHISLTITFPQCWDGKNLDSLNHKNHMAYATPGQGCPSSHPVALPEISINVRYRIPASGTAGWRLSSDTYSKSIAGGYSLHGDFMNGWRNDIAAKWIKNCNNTALDCHAHLLGDGTTLY
jgi:hypothetical protein